MQSRWRLISIKVIAPIESEYRDKPYVEFRRALRDAYPFYDREYHPYKIWCQEQKKALARHPGAPNYKPEATDTQGLLI